MKKIYAVLTALVLTIAATGQTLNVKMGSVTYQFPASQTGDMPYENGEAVTIMGKTFTLSEVDAMTIDDTEVTDNSVNISYDGTTATVTVSGNVAQWVTPTVDGAHVSIEQTNTEAIDDDEITYTLSGSTTNGSLTLSGSYKCTVALAGLTLTNPNGAAINITNGKRIQLSIKKNTVNTLTDGANGSQKACIYSKGQIQLQGNGTLNVVGNTKHAIKSGDYITVKNLTLNITKAVGDGINCEEYFQMKSGTVSISGTGDDGIQCDLGGDTSTGETTDHEDEDSGNIYLEGGTLTVTTTAAAAKGIKASGDLVISDGDITVTTTGNGAYDSDDQDAKGSACLKADGNMAINGGTLTLKSTGTGGKCIKADGTLTISNGTVSATTTGTKYTYSSRLTASPKAIKADSGLTISGGTVYAKSTYHEGIESKGALTVSGGYVYVESSDDAINAAGDLTITGGYVMANSNGNDGIDANGNCYIKGGNVVAVAASQPEVGIDANTEGGKQLYITGGNVVAIGGFERGSSITGGTAKSASYSKGTWYGLYNGSTTAFAFKVPSNSRMGSSMVVYTTGTPALKSGVTGSGDSFWNGNGYASCSGGSNVTLSNYSNSSGGGPGGGGGRW